MSKKISRISMAAAEDHIKKGAEEYGVLRVAEDCKQPAAEFAEEVLRLVGKQSAKYAKEFNRITIKQSDVQKAIKDVENYIRVGMNTLN